MALTPEQIDKIEQYINVYDPNMIGDPNLEFVMEDSADSLSEKCFGKQFEKAVAFLTMHTLTVAAQTSGSSSEGGSAATGGAVIQRTIGPITIKWANPKDSHSSKYFDTYKTTKYGQMLLDLIQTCTLGMGISVTNEWGRF